MAKKKIYRGGIFGFGEMGQEATTRMNFDRWYGDEADYFRVRVAGGDLYVLKHLRGHDRWELTSFTQHGSVGTSVEKERPRVIH